MNMSCASCGMDFRWMCTAVWGELGAATHLSALAVSTLHPSLPQRQDPFLE